MDDECYRSAIGEALGVPPGAIDWSGAAHVTDSEIFRWLCATHHRREPSTEEMSGARSRFVDRLTRMLEQDPRHCPSISGARAMLDSLHDRGWSVAIATGGWGPSARLKLRTAELAIDDALLASADDGVSRADIVTVARLRAEAFYARRFDRIVSIGDGVWDVSTAVELGLPFVGIATEERADRLRRAGARTVLADYSNLDAVWGALQNAMIPVAHADAE
jgi:phosphoglycolate phosphatase-like HAD superfamily hydrolase